LPVRAKRDVEAALKKKGFRQDEGDHHWSFYWTADGLKTTIRTKTSHGSRKDLGDGLLREMAREFRASIDRLATPSLFPFENWPGCRVRLVV
jgi:hypothetical protein